MDQRTRSFQWIVVNLLLLIARRAVGGSPNRDELATLKGGEEWSRHNEERFDG